MAIFKKILVTAETSSATKKISTTTIIPSSFLRGFNQPQQQQGNSNASCSSSYNEQSSINACLTNANDQHIPEEIETFCWYIYNKALRRDQVRLIIFSEKDNRLLYDSETVVPTSDCIVSGSHRSQCGRFQFLPHKYDTLKIAKMLFGTLPSSLKSDSLKIHSLKDSKSIMISRVFTVTKIGKYSPLKSSDLYKCMVGSFSSDSDNQSNYSTIRSLEGIRDKEDSASCTCRFPLISSKTFINPDPPEKFVRVRNSSLQFESNDLDDIMEELRAFSPNRLSRARRRQLSQLGLDDSISIRLSNRSRLSSCSSIADACGFSDSSTDLKQYGFAVLFPAEFRSFIFQHILQVERELDRLVMQIHKAVQDKSQFFQTIYNGWNFTCNSICILCNSLRIKNPVWLSLASSEPGRKISIANEFCNTLVQLIESLNTKETKFFISTLLSAILMNHLTWVASVSPPEKCSYDRSLLIGTSVIDPKQMSYNPTVAQLLELYYGIGAVNDGSSRFTKIVVIGEKAHEIAKLLHVLSYFIRCSSVESQRSELLDHCLLKDKETLHDFGRTLLAGICLAYSPHFVLSGIQTTRNAFDDLLRMICEDVRHPMGEPCTNSQLILNLSPSNSQTISNISGLKAQSSPSNMNTTVLSNTQKRSTSKRCTEKCSPEKLQKKNCIHGQQEEKIDSLVIVVDMITNAVRIISSENCQVDDVPFYCPSEAITSMLEEFADLHSCKCAPDFLLAFLEDRLGSLLAKSNILVNLLTTTEGKEPLSMQRVSTILNCDCSDLRLILNIAAVYSPGILATAV